MRKLEDVLQGRLGRQKSDLKKARFYIRNGLVFDSVNSKCVNPKKEVGRDFKFRVSSKKLKLSREGLWLLKSTSMKSEDRSRLRPSNRGSGKKIEACSMKGRLRRQPRATLWQRDFYKRKNIVSFYGLKSMKSVQSKGWPSTNGLGSLFYRDNERRLDVLLVRLGYCSNLNEAKLCIRRGYVCVNNVKVKSHLFRVNAFSTIGVYDTKLPFKLLHTEHLSNFPKMWRPPRLCYRLKGKSEGKIGKVSCVGRENGGSKHVKFVELLSYLRRKNKWSGSRGKFRYFKKVVHKASFVHPIHDLNSSVCRVSSNKFLVSNLSKNKSIRVPSSMSV